MKRGAYYNEIDPYAAAWLRNLIARGLIAAGDVDQRDLRDVTAAEVRGYVQCHYFAGIGVWSHALRLAGWPDDQEVWTGSCPCQPFSAAGRGDGFADERHLWPSWHWLIRECRPSVILGEQVASSAADAWLDLVQHDLEALGYAVGAVPIPAAGIGAPHIRDRLWWVADDMRDRLQGRKSLGAAAGGRRSPDASGACVGELGHAGASGLPLRERRALVGAGRGQEGRAAQQSSGASGGLADAAGSGRVARLGHAGSPRHELHNEGGGETGAERPGPLHGFWRVADWLLCRDGKWRPVEPGTFPLVDGAAARVGRLRAYGNAIVAPVAAAFIEEVMRARP